MDLIVAHDKAELAKARDAITAKGRDLLTARGRDHLTARDRVGVTEEHTEDTVALVPTMGALHEGHRSLIRLARERADHVVVSVFVNPLQFGPNEDFSRYPRTFDADLEVCREEGVQLVFAPAADEMYLPDRQITVSSGQMGTVVEGAFRPGHFDGVLTIVLKLFNLVRPDVAIFGQKDAQQLALIRRMAGDLDLPIEILAGPTVREPDGLALSSRNRYLAPDQREIAVSLSKALFAGAEHSKPSEIVGAARVVLDLPGLDVDYLVLVDPATFTEVKDGYVGEAVLAVAARVGTTRLIDNVVLTLR